MNNRIAFIDFVRGLLNINPLERWSPQQAKLHPFITQQKFTGPFVPPSNLKSPTGTNRSPAPGTQQQMQAEAASKERARAAQAHLAQVYNNTIPPTQHMPQTANSYSHHSASQGPPIYNGNQSMYGPPTHAQPPYPMQANPYAQQAGMMPQAQAQMPPAQYGNSGHPQQQQQSLYTQATTRAGRQRATTMEVQQSAIPSAIQRVASHLDPSQPIRLQPSPAYYPPPADADPNHPGSARRRGSRAPPGAQHGRGGMAETNFVRQLEESTAEGGYMNQQLWH